MTAPESLLVETTSGPIIGFEDSYPITEHSTAPLIAQGKLGPEAPIKKWLGIPYAQAERWTRPRPPTPWKEPLACQEFGPCFPQHMSPAVAFYRQKPGIVARDWVQQSEEKGFNLNVFAPKESKEGDKLPVLVYFYGGALLTGDNSTSVYDPTEWIRRESHTGRKFIVVVGNYRVNVFGFLANRDFMEQDPQGLAGNYGLYDSIAQLEWVQHNIAKFGGDPDNVTTFGQSAGGSIIGQLLVVQKKLFRRAILQSGFPGTMPNLTLEEHEDVYKKILEKCSIAADTPAGRVEALRKMSAAELLAAIPPGFGQFSFSIENKDSSNAIWTSDTVLDDLKEGRWNPHIESVMMGVCKDEGSLIAFIVQCHSPAGYEIARQQLFPDVPKEKLALLYPTPNPDEKSSKIDYTSSPGSLEICDRLFHVPMEVLANALSGIKNFQTQKPLQLYVYVLTATVVGIEEGTGLGAFHSVDVPLIFNIKAAWASDSPNAKTSAALGQCWYNFAESGCPDMTWPQYDGPSAPFRKIFLQDGNTVIDDLAGRSDNEKARFELWSPFIR